MSVCGQTEEESVSEEMGAPIREIYEQKSVSKVVRVLTVLAYLLSVSLAAILLSVYYVCVWKSPEPPLSNDTEEISARRGDHHDYTSHGAAPESYYRGSNTSVNELVTTMPLAAEVGEDFVNASGSPVSDLDVVFSDTGATALYNDTTDDGPNNNTGTLT
ncbi:uncharacterized protein inaF-D isoform X2 [Plodia interpunctella]|uniref:uncharacterized protein inaF-D isoform X2 n=1 Tax=Plodia interpunctella TaxID=58824 RepID=UPI002367BA7A|nr:uncharacterized protein LOC128677342 isoform X2 [Plodia interpunctella]